jgi:nitroimidazol reductase NimA-like FMN-containing flavoprotein (pyridoxamine 5'-phosphate oxidase superfamily)
MTMSTTEPTVRFDDRFSDPAASATPWAEAERVLEEAELYWITTVRADGRPHVTPLIGLMHDGALHFSTGPREQKYRNLEHSPRVALTTGNNTWAAGLDVVVEGQAVRVSDDSRLQELADGYEAKYGSFWHFDVDDGMFSPSGGGGVDGAVVFRVEASKVMAFAKGPHGQTSYRFS